MTHKEWIHAVVAHNDSVPVPYHYSFTPPAKNALLQHYGVTGIEDRLSMPIRTKSASSKKPSFADPAVYGDSVSDEFGVVWSTNAIDRGSPIVHPLTKPDLTNYQFPDPTVPYRFEGLSKWLAANQEHFTIMWVGDMWERATFLRGMENILFDVAESPEFVEELLDGITDYILQTMAIFFAHGEFDAIALSDDYGMQTGMLMSPASWRQLVKPRLARIYAFAKSHGRLIYHHSCGHIVPIIGEMIDIGMDILQPIQPEAMDILALKKEFGQHVTFAGGLSTQNLLPHGTPEEVRAEVRRLKEVMGAGGGYILEPGITLQADIPIANLVAMVEEAMQE